MSDCSGGLPRYPTSSFTQIIGTRRELLLQVVPVLIAVVGVNVARLLWLVGEAPLRLSILV